jgi:hypothetical protein
LAHEQDQPSSVTRRYNDRIDNEKRGKVTMRTLHSLLLASLIALSPLSVMAEDAPSAEPDVTIRQDGDKKIEEYRQNGFLYAIKITPKGMKPYFLVRADGSQGNFIRSDQPDMLIPSWEIFSW